MMSKKGANETLFAITHTSTIKQRLAFADTFVLLCKSENTVVVTDVIYWLLRHSKGEFTNGQCKPSWWWQQRKWGEIILGETS